MEYKAASLFPYLIEWGCHLNLQATLNIGSRRRPRRPVACLEGTVLVDIGRFSRWHTASYMMRVPSPQHTQMLA